MTSCKCGAKQLLDIAPWQTVGDEVHTASRCGLFTWVEGRVGFKGGVLQVTWPDGTRTSTEGRSASRETAKADVIGELERLASKCEQSKKMEEAFLYRYAAKAVKGAR